METNVFPIYKGIGEMNIAKNYRPIFLTCTCILSKVFEKLILKFTAPIHSGPHSRLLLARPCINPCLFDVELASQSQSLFLTNQINRNLVHLKRL
jgi:hypothetical protein